MAAAEIWRRYGARATMELDDGLLSITYSGPVTVASWREAAECADEAAGGAAVVLLADFSRAVVAVDPGELGGVQPVRTALTRRSLPGAMVVPEIHLETYRAFAWELALQGIERAVFTSPLAALSWAQALVQKRRAWGLAPLVLSALPLARPRRTPHALHLSALPR